MTHPIETLYDVSRTHRTATASTRPEWGNMVGPFGGATVATILNIIQTDPEAFGRPASLTLNFAAPLADGEYTVDYAPVRTNRTNQHWTATIAQDGKVCATGTALFAVERDTLSTIEASPPQVPGPEDLQVAPFPPVLAWAGNYEMRFADGIVPGPEGTTGGSTVSTYWLRQSIERHWDYPSLGAAADTFFPRVYIRAGAGVPAGTVTMTLYFHASPDEITALGPDLLCTAEASRFHNGLGDQTARIWSADGNLLVSSHQMIYFKG